MPHGWMVWDIHPAHQWWANSCFFAPFFEILKESIFVNKNWVLLDVVNLQPISWHYPPKVSIQYNISIGIMYKNLFWIFYITFGPPFFSPPTKTPSSTNIKDLSFWVPLERWDVKLRYESPISSACWICRSAALSFSCRWNVPVIRWEGEVPGKIRDT